MNQMRGFAYMANNFVSNMKRGRQLNLDENRLNPTCNYSLRLMKQNYMFKYDDMIKAILYSYVSPFMGAKYVHTVYSQIGAE